MPAKFISCGLRCKHSTQLARRVEITSCELTGAAVYRSQCGPQTRCGPRAAQPAAGAAKRESSPLESAAPEQEGPDCGHWRLARAFVSDRSNGWSNPARKRSRSAGSPLASSVSPGPANAGKTSRGFLRCRAGRCALEQATRGAAGALSECTAPRHRARGGGARRAARAGGPAGRRGRRCHCRVRGVCRCEAGSSADLGRPSARPRGKGLGVMMDERLFVPAAPPPAAPPPTTGGAGQRPRSALQASPRALLLGEAAQAANRVPRTGLDSLPVRMERRLTPHVSALREPRLEHPPPKPAQRAPQHAARARGGGACMQVAALHRRRQGTRLPARPAPNGAPETLLIDPALCAAADGRQLARCRAAAPAPAGAADRKGAVCSDHLLGVGAEGAKEHVVEGGADAVAHLGGCRGDRWV